MRRVRSIPEKTVDGEVQTAEEVPVCYGLTDPRLTVRGH